MGEHACAKNCCGKMEKRENGRKTEGNRYKSKHHMVVDAISGAHQTGAGGTRRHRVGSSRAKRDEVGKNETRCDWVGPMQRGGANWGDEVGTGGPPEGKSALHNAIPWKLHIAFQ
jgi:hypothetical protein